MAQTIGQRQWCGEKVRKIAITAVIMQPGSNGNMRNTNFLVRQVVIEM